MHEVSAKATIKWPVSLDLLSHSHYQEAGACQARSGMQDQMTMRAISYLLKWVIILLKPPSERISNIWPRATHSPQRNKLSPFYSSKTGLEDAKTLCGIIIIITFLWFNAANHKNCLNHFWKTIASFEKRVYALRSSSAGLRWDTGRVGCRIRTAICPVANSGSSGV